MALDASSTEEARIALSAAGPIPNAVLYNNAKDLAAAMEAGGVVFGGGGGAGVPVGTILHTGQSVIPAGFLDCDGSSQLRSVYPDLFDEIGTTYGPGAVPGTTFALPTVVGTYGNFVICADAAAVVVETRSLIGAPIGTLLLYADSTYPTGWLRADGTAISRTTYADLFAILGTTYGVGDGSTTFNLPNLLSSGSPSPVYIIKAILSGSVEPSTVAHAPSHIRAGTDVIDGDRVQVDYVPTRYVRNAAATGAGAVTDLTAHLDGVNTLAGQGHIVCTSSTRPSSPATGTMIYETDTGFIVVYNGTSWVQMMSPAAPPGVVLIQPTSVSGTGVSVANGLVSFSGTSQVFVNGVFSSAFKNYRLIFNAVGTQASITNVRFRWRASGVDYDNDYYNRMWYQHLGTFTTAAGDNAVHAEWQYVANLKSYWTMDIFDPNVNTYTSYIAHHHAYGSTNNLSGETHSWNNAIRVYDGFSLNPTNGTMAGTLSVYGIRGSV